MRALRTKHDGDGGETALPGGGRVRKDDPRVEACGAIDELNSALGLLRAHLPSGCDEETDLLRGVQVSLLAVGTQLAATDAAAPAPNRLPDGVLRELESAIVRIESTLPPLHHFLVPGGCMGAAQCHVARSVCRRAERRCVTAACSRGSGAASRLAPALAFLNRLSGYLFALARQLDAGTEEG